MQKIYVIHENPEWIAPLATALDGLDLPWAEWPATGGAIFFDQAPPEGVFYNRVGASSYLRGNKQAPEYTRLLLRWLERHGRRVINGEAALNLEIDKSLQYTALNQAGIATPRTAVITGKHHVLQAAHHFGKGPYILKPNRGGMGAGVKRFDTIEEIRAFLDDPLQPEPVDDIWLLQEYIENPQGVITRCDFVDGQFLYAMQVDTRGGFQLCPAGVCSLTDRPANGTADYQKFKILRDFDNQRLIEAYRRFLFTNKIDTAGIEFVTDRFGNAYTYDINVNTNYNLAAEAAAGIKLNGMKAIANFLAGELYGNYHQSKTAFHPARLCG